MKRSVVVLTRNPADSVGLSEIIVAHRLVALPLSCLDAVEGALDGGEVLAIIIDLDGFTIDNRFIRRLKGRFPDTTILLASSRREHPHLETAMVEYVYACLVKPIDPEEIGYWLKCIAADGPAPAGG